MFDKCVIAEGFKPAIPFFYLCLASGGKIQTKWGSLQHFNSQVVTGFHPGIISKGQGR